DPSNVSPLMHGAEMRVAETRAVSRALRKAYGIGICSVEELRSAAESRISAAHPKKPSQSVNRNYSGPKRRGAHRTLGLGSSAGLLFVDHGHSSGGAHRFRPQAISRSAIS